MRSGGVENESGNNPVRNVIWITIQYAMASGIMFVSLVAILKN